MINIEDYAYSTLDENPFDFDLYEQENEISLLAVVQSSHIIF